MDFFRQWVLCVCISLIIAAVLSLFTPSGKLSGFYKTLISVFVFLSFLYPLKDVKDSGFTLRFPETAVTQSDGDSVYARTVEKQVCRTLEENGFTGVNCEAQVTADFSQGTAEIKSVTVFVSDGNDCGAVKKTLLDKLGINAEVKRLGD